MPALLAQYALMNRCVVWPAIDDMPTIEPPPPRIITGAACLMQRNVPTRLRSTVARHAATSDATIGPPCSEPPAHANSTSSLPVGSVAAATARSTSASSVTSHTTYCAVAPGAATAAISSTASASRASVRPAIVTCAPSAANRFAHPSPMPLPPPVTSAAIPSMPGTAAASGSVDDRDRLLRADPRRFLALGLSSSGGSSWSTYRKSSSRTSNTSGAAAMHSALLSHLSKSTTTRKLMCSSR